VRRSVVRPCEPLASVSGSGSTLHPLSDEDHRREDRPRHRCQHPAFPPTTQVRSCGRRHTWATDHPSRKSATRSKRTPPGQRARPRRDQSRTARIGPRRFPGRRRSERVTGTDAARCAWTAESISRQRAIRAAVLIEAIRCLVGAARIRERPACQSARHWIGSLDTKAPYSFNNICEALALDPSRLRRSLLDPAFDASGVPRTALGQARPVGTSGHRSIRRPIRKRSRYIRRNGA